MHLIEAEKEQLAVLDPIQELLEEICESSDDETWRRLNMKMDLTANPELDKSAFELAQETRRADKLGGDLTSN